MAAIIDRLSRSQNGSVLLEYMLVMTLALLAAVWAVGAWADKKTELRVHSTVVWMQALQQALERYIEKYGQDLRSEEHTSELQSRGHLVCRLLLEKKNKPTSRSVQHWGLRY